MRIFYFVIFFLLLLGCDQKQQEMKQLVEYWTYREIIFPEGLEMKIQGRDTIDEFLFEHKFKILNYVDTSGCNECMLKFYEWRQLKKEIDSLGLDVGIVYVVFSNHYKVAEVSQILNKFDLPLLYDPSGNMAQQNHFPQNPLYRAFLLDSLNRVIGIGNPVLNKKVWELYREKISM